MIAAAGLLAPVAATASMGQESIFEDDDVLLQRGAARQASGLTEIAALGADTVRVLVFWRDVVPSRDRRRRPATLWDRHDDVVRGANARNLGVLLTPTGPTPRWASGCSRVPAAQRGCKPDVRAYERFVRALGRRYSGSHRDENQGGGVLPRVDRWSIWNEPNLPGWLSPQFARRHGRLVDVAAIRYRKLAAAGVRALRATGHGADRVLLGETAPVGRTSGRPALRPAAPVTFLQALFCIDRRGRRLRGRAARLAGCRRVARLRVNGFAHHPYTQGGHDAPFTRPSPGQISFDSVGRLKRLLAQGARSRVIPPRLGIWYTEFGYQSNPPDPRLGVPLALQAQYLNQADYVAAHDPRIRSVAQYKLVDDQHLGAFQSGLRRFGSLSRKPAYGAYRLPIWAVRRGSSVRIYGQLRPAVNGSPARAAIQNAPAPGGRFKTVRELTVTSVRGQFEQTVPYRPGVWRLAFSPAPGTTLVSRTAAAGRR